MKQKLFSLGVLTLLLFSGIFINSGYTVRGPTWTSSSANFAIDQSFQNWVGGSNAAYGTVRNAASDWSRRSGNGLNFDYWENTTNSDWVQATSMPNCNCTAQTTRNWNGNAMVRMVIQVNTSGIGHSWGQLGYLPANWYDLHSEMDHEFGHGIALCHSGNANNLMNHVPPGVVMNLDFDAIQGSRDLYGHTQQVGPEGACIP